MDINLPGISGIEALKILRADPATAHIPVIALSANAMPRDIEKGLEAGFFRYLTKPIKVNEFMDALDVALKFAQTAIGRRSRKRTGMMISRSRHSQRQHPDRRRSGGQRQPARAMLREAGYTRVASTMNPHEVCALHRKNRYDLILLDLQMPGMDGFQVMEGLKTNDARRLSSGARDHRPTRPQAARAAGRREGFHQQAVRPGRSQDAHPQHAGSAAAVQEARELQQGARSRRCRNAPPNCARAKRAIAA